MLMIRATVRIFHTRSLVDLPKADLMADFLRRHLYIVSANNRSSVMGSNWPKDKSCVQKIDKPGRSFLLICGDVYVNTPNKKKGVDVMKPLSFSFIGIVALALFTSAADAQIQPWNTIILVNRFQVLSQFGNAAVFDKELVWFGSSHRIQTL